MILEFISEHNKASRCEHAGSTDCDRVTNAPRSHPTSGDVDLDEASTQHSGDRFVARHGERGTIGLGCLAESAGTTQKVGASRLVQPAELGFLRYRSERVEPRIPSITEPERNRPVDLDYR